MSEPGGEVRYTMKEILTRIEGKVDHLHECFERQMGTLEIRVSAMEARQPYREELDKRFIVLEGQVQLVMQKLAVAESMSVRDRWLIGTGLAFGGLIVATIGMALKLVGHA